MSEDRKQLQFDHWLVDMDDAIDRFVDTLAPEFGDRLDSSIQSLDALESWLLQRYPNVDAALAADQATAIDGAARYVGEVFRKELGGRWALRMGDQNSAFSGMPELVGFKMRTPLCPLSLVTASTDRRTGTYLRSVFEAYAKHARS